jgi:hypothetical protein
MNEALRKALAEGRCADVPDVATALSISPNSLYRAIQRGEVTATRVGGRVTIPPAVARRLLGLPAQDAAAA